MSAPTVTQPLATQPLTTPHHPLPGAATATAAADGAAAGATSASLAVGLLWAAASVDHAGASLRPWGAVAVVAVAAALWALGAAVAAAAGTAPRWPHGRPLSVAALALGPAVVGVVLDDLALSGALAVTGQGWARTALVVVAATSIAAVLSVHPLATLRRTAGSSTAG